MTGDQITVEYDEGEPDGFVLVHQPTPGVQPYGIGPFPPVPGLPEDLIAAKACDCAITVLWVRFPKGVRMMVTGPSALIVIEEEEPDALVN